MANLIKISGGSNANIQGKALFNAAATPTYNIGRSLSAVNEGSSVTFTLSTTNVANGTAVPYTISGISSNDVTTGSLTGSFTVSNNLATATITMSADQLTEGAETATLTLNNAAASNFVLVNDTSMAPTYAIGRSLSAVNEGSSVVFTLSTTNVANGTVLPYTISGISSNDVTTGSLTGSFTVNSGLATTTITMSADQLTEGAETATLTLNNAAASNFVLVNDTSVFTPATISGLQLWLDAADSSTLFDATAGGNLVTTDGAAVARWQDKSGNGRHISQGTANARPALKTGIKNAKNVIRFDGVNDILSIANSAISQSIGVLNLFAVCRSTKTLSASVYQTVIHNSIGTAGGPARSSIYITNAIEVGGRRLDTDSYQFVKPGTLVTNEWVLAGANFNYNAASLTAYKNGTGASRSPSFQTVGTTSNTPSLLFGIGGTIATSSDWLTGDIAEIIIYNSALTTTQRQAVETYLNSKWALY